MSSFVILLMIVLAMGAPQEEPGKRAAPDINTSQVFITRLEFDMLERDLHFWQNKTLALLTKYALNDQENQCSLQQDVQHLQEQHDVLTQKLDNLITKLDNHSQKQTGMPTSFPLGTFLNPAASCKNIPTSSPSGNYWIQSTSTGYATMKYCRMSPPCSCSRPSGWMRVAELNMTDPQEHCPSGFKTITSPKRMCGRLSGPGCASVIFPVNGVHYSRVCGRIIGYQYYSMDAFSFFYQDQSRTIDNIYVDGVSLTHGHSPRQHIWTFANALDEIGSYGDHNVCPCTETHSPYTGVVPQFIGNDYFCATGSRYRFQNQWYTEDPLWDGEGCGGRSTCCEFNNPPWFCKDLPQSTTDDIELRLCSDQNTDNEDSGLELINIYVQ